jgi:hypothetical protein
VVGLCRVRGRKAERAAHTINPPSSNPVTRQREKQITEIKDFLKYLISLKSEDFPQHVF